MTYEVVAGDPGSPVILHVPHASRSVVPSGLLLSPQDLAAELDHMTDAWTDVIAARAASSCGRRPWMLVNRLSRLVVDPERFADDSEEMLAAGMGPVYTHGYAGRRLRPDDPARDAALLEEHFFPYAERMATLTGERLAATGRAVILDIHSYPTTPLPYELHGDGPRPPVCLGTEGAHTPQWLADAAQQAFGAGSTGINSPFAGCYVPTAFWQTNTAVSALMVEIRRDQYMIEPGGRPTGGLDRLALALAALIDEIP